jgi:hypothetical protein
MANVIKTKLVKYVKYLGGENGQALLSVLAFLLISSLTLPPILSHLGTSLETGRVYEDKTDALYAADSGIEDALWQIKYDRLEPLLTNPDYDIYDFGTTWSYSLNEPINNLTANVSIRNVWIPSNVSPPSDPVEAREIIESNKLMVAGTATDESSYKIKISFSPGEGEEEALMVESLGIWLPLGFHYSGSCSLADEPGAEYYSENVTDYAGGESVVWEFSPPVAFTSFGADPGEMPMITEVTFQYTADEAGARPATVSWLETYGAVSDILPVTWDIDTRIYKITSVAGDTEIEAYSSKCELRKMGAAIAGDYRAIGNSLMRDKYYPYDKRDTLLDKSSTELDTIPNDAEEGFADVIQAHLYWSGWRKESRKQTEFSDTCDNFGNWISGSCWDIGSHNFRSHYSSSGEDPRLLTLKDQYSLELSSYADLGAVTVSWKQWETGDLESDDGLDFAFSPDGGDTWSSNFEAFRGNIGSSPKYFEYVIPAQYLTDDFKLRFYLVGFVEPDDHHCYIDNIKVSGMMPDYDAVFEIDDTQVYLLDGEPTQGDADIVATRTQVLPNYESNGNPNGFSYSCYLDVTKLVKEYAEVVEDEYGIEHHTGNEKYTVGDVEADTDNKWSYAGWSLIIIYSSPETAGHQLYLWDDFMYADEYTDIDFDGDGEVGGDITGFVVPEQIEGDVNAATLACFVGEGDSYTGDFIAFNAPEIYRTNPNGIPDTYKFWDGTYPKNLDNVWNSKSVGFTADGVDIDTFYVTWESGLLEPGDTTAHIDLPTGTDSWNLIYIILSMCSETVTGGTEHYVIHYG